MAAISATLKAPFREANRDLARREMADLAARLSAGTLTADRFAAGMADELTAAAAAAFRFGLGRAPTVAEANDLATLLDRHGSYLLGLVADAPGLTAEALAARAALYAGAANEAHALGTLAAAGPTGAVAWRGPDGAASCADCAAHIGQTYTPATLAALGVRPGNGVSCGPNCRCWLEPVEE